jgi:hypothetical protein
MLMNQKQTIAFIGVFGTFLLIPILLNQVTAGCIDRADAGPAWLKGYSDAQRDFHSKGFDDSTHLADKQNYQAGYQTGWNDAQKGVNGPFC